MLALALKQEVDNENKYKAPKSIISHPFVKSGERAYAPLTIVKYS